MKKLYLYMGLHKTGTSSFQDTCNANLNLLSAQGFEYPIFNSFYMIMKNMYNHSAPIYSLFCSEPEKYHINVRCDVENINDLNKDYRATLIQSLSKDKDIIICGEDISSLDCKCLERLKTLIEKYNFEILPIVVVRPPYEFACSMKQENIKSNMYCDKNFFSSRIKRIENIKKAFPNTKFLAFKEICKHEQGLVAFLLDYMQVDYKDFDIINSNKGVYNLLTRVQNIINSSTIHWKNAIYKPNYESIGSLLHKYLKEEENLFEEKFLLTKEEFAFIEEKCNKENAYFKEHLGEEFCDKEIQFINEDARIAYLTENIEKNITRQGLDDEEQLKLYGYFIHKAFAKKL